MNSRGPVYAHGVMSPPPSKQASMLSQSSNNNAIFGVTSPRQGQLALYHDGFQVGSPQPMPQSPYPQPVHRNTLMEDAELQEFLENKRRQQLAMVERQQQQQSLQQQQQQDWAPQQQQDDHQRAQQEKWARFQRWEQQQQQQQQQQQRSPPPPTDSYPLPPHFGQQPRSGHASMDENDQQYHQQYHQQSASPQPQMYARRPGNTYGTIKVRGKAKTVIGNVYSGDTPTGFEREHTYNMVDIDEDVHALIGDTPAAEMRNFYQRGPPPS